MLCLPCMLCSIRLPAPCRWRWTPSGLTNIWPCSLIIILPAPWRWRWSRSGLTKRPPYCQIYYLNHFRGCWSPTARFAELWTLNTNIAIVIRRRSGHLSEDLSEDLRALFKKDLLLFKKDLPLPFCIQSFQSSNMPLFEVIPQGHCVWTWTKWKATEGLFCHAKFVLETTALAANWRGWFMLVMLIRLRKNNVLQDG